MRKKDIQQQKNEFFMQKITEVDIIRLKDKKKEIMK